MEGRVEDGDVLHVGEGRLRRADALQVGGVVQRREVCEVLDVDLDQRRHDRRLEEALAAVHDAVPDRGERVLVEARPLRFERVEHHPERRRVLRDGERGLPRAARPRVADVPGALADALDQPGGKRRLARSVDQLVLERRRAAVDHQHRAHEIAAWIAVIATVLTMSSTSAPRDRSLIGLRRPCSTGPIATAPALRCTAL